jgi:formylglycine-generating enzyme required for sulfatase activity
MTLVSIPAGWFWMGSEGRYSWESPRHQVWIDAFAIAKTPVTRGEYARFLAETGHAEPAGWADPRFSLENQPVVGVSWFAAIAYCEWFSSGKSETYRLPTEAEWEKACRGGVENAEYAWGNESPEALDYFRSDWTAPRPVGEWRSNGYGLFNMGDNVHEWCSDWYAENYYSVSPERNPTGPESGTRRVSRGGSWRHQIKASRAAHRSSLPPGFAYTDYGFRVVRQYESTSVTTETQRGLS